VKGQADAHPWNLCPSWQKDGGKKMKIFYFFASIFLPV